jgi:outer membrane protein insertion porin family
MMMRGHHPVGCGRITRPGRAPVQFAAVLAAAFAAVWSPRAAAADRIREIHVVENTKTTSDTVRYIAGVEEGEDWDDDRKEAVRTELVSSGLFKQVDLYAEPHPQGGVRLVIVAVDKHSWVVAPTFYNQPTNKGGGLGFGENNLFGENKKLLLYGQAATGDSFFLGAYIDPSIAGTRMSWGTDVFLRYERVIEYEMPLAMRRRVRPVRQSKLMYLNGAAKFGVSLFRSLTFEQRLRAAKVAFYRTGLAPGRSDEDVGIAPGEPVPEPGAEGWDVSTETMLTFDRRANWYGITRGARVKLSYEQAQTVLGSDFDYWYATLNVELAQRFFVRHNLILRGTFGYGDDLPFQQEYTSGGTTLRGYENKEFRGDAKAGGNLEYSIPFFTVRGVSVRGLAFFDSAYTRFLDDRSDNSFRSYLPNAGKGGLAPFRNAAGGGIRLFVRQVVLPLLGLDVGYGIESRGVEVYLAIGVGDF